MDCYSSSWSRTQWMPRRAIKQMQEQMKKNHKKIKQIQAKAEQYHENENTEIWELEEQLDLIYNQAK